MRTGPFVGVTPAESTGASLPGTTPRTFGPCPARLLPRGRDHPQVPAPAGALARPSGVGGCRPAFRSGRLAHRVGQRLEIVAGRNRQPVVALVPDHLPALR